MFIYPPTTIGTDGMPEYHLRPRPLLPVQALHEERYESPPERCSESHSRAKKGLGIMDTLYN